MNGARPKHESTWQDYQARILRVLVHIQSHLDEALDLEVLSRTAGFSSFHFHRIFAAMTGETLADHVRRLRLERAALALRAGPQPVIHVALDAGYEAHEGFTRAFKAAYGLSPTAFRRAPGPVALPPAPSGVHYRLGTPLTAFKTPSSVPKTMKVSLQKIPAWRVAYLRHVGPYEAVNQTWTELLARLTADRQLHRRSKCIGIGHDNPAHTPAAELRYDACVTVSKTYEPKPPVAVQIMAGGDYAVVKNCPVAKIKDAFQHLYGRWLGQSGRELRPAPGFVVHVGPRDIAAPRKQRVDVHLPLLPQWRARPAAPRTIEVTTLAPRRVAYLRHVGPYETVYRAWLDLAAHLRPHGLPHADSLLIGVPLDDPQATPPEQLRYDACVVVDEHFTPPKAVRVRTLAGGDYAVARNCPLGELARGYTELYGTWLPKSGRRARPAPSLLVAVNRVAGLPPTFHLTDIHVPLENSPAAPV
jgi:AraC family transcriptional regulator